MERRIESGDCFTEHQNPKSFLRSICFPVSHLRSFSYKNVSLKMFSEVGTIFVLSPQETPSDLLTCGVKVHVGW